MDYRIDSTLAYILFLTRHIPKRNIRAAALVMMMDMRFPEYADGFGYLMTAMVMKAENIFLRIGDIYQKVASMQELETNDQQVEQGIRSLISDAWKHGDTVKWMIYFSTDGEVLQERPTNGKVISRFGNLLKLLKECSEEVSYAG